MSSATYRTLLRLPGAAAFFLTAAIGRVGIAMTSLGIVWLVHGTTGSYAVSGLVTGAFAVAEALAGPQLARLIDRFGQTRVLPPALLAHAASVAVLLVAAVGHAPTWLLTAGGALAGATIPQLGALSGARWATLLRSDAPSAAPHRDDARSAASRRDEAPSATSSAAVPRGDAGLRTAFSLESMANGMAFLIGPALVSALGASGNPVLGTSLATALIVAGGIALAAQRRTAPTPEPSATERRQASRSLLRPAFALMIALNLAIGVYFGATTVSTTAFTVQLNAPDAAAPIFAVSSCGGLLAGWLYGLSRWRAPAQTQLLIITTVLTLAAALPLIASTPLHLGLISALTGAAIPPILVLFSVLTEKSVHPAVLTQAFTWLNSASAAGSAAASALSGWVADMAGAQYGFAIAATGAAVMAVLAMSLRGRR